MILLRRTIPVISPLLVAAAFVTLFLRPDLWHWSVGSILVLSILSIAGLTGWKLGSTTFWGMLFPLFTFLLGGTGLLFFLNTPTTQYAFAAFLTVVFFVYLEDVFFLVYQRARYVNMSLPNLGGLMNMFTAFSLFSFGFALRLVDVIPYWVIVVLAFVFGALMMFHLLWSYTIWERSRMPWVILVAVLTTQLAWALQYLPNPFLVKGMILAVFFYVVPSLIRHHFRESLTKRVIIQYCVFGIAVLATILGTSQWK